MRAWYLGTSRSSMISACCSVSLSGVLDMMLVLLLVWNPLLLLKLLPLPPFIVVVVFWWWLLKAFFFWKMICWILSPGSLLPFKYPSGPEWTPTSPNAEDCSSFCRWTKSIWSKVEEEKKNGGVKIIKIINDITHWPEIVYKQLCRLYFVRLGIAGAESWTCRLSSPRNR